MSESVHFLVVTADTGFGHRSAANAVAAALQNLYGEDCAVEVVNPLDDRRTPAILRESQSDYDKFVRNMPDLWRLEYQISDTAVPGAVVERALTVLLFRVMRSIIKNTRPNAIISTHPFFAAPMNAYITIRKLGIPILTAVTDLTNVHRMWFNQGSDLCLLPTRETYQQALAGNFPRDRLEVTGIPIHPTFANEARPKEVLRAELGWAISMTTVLVVGSKRVRNLMSVLHLLNHSGLPIQLVLVAGGDIKLFNQLKATAWHTVTHVYNYITNMPQFMHAADMIISKAGGLIVTEALACGLPLLLVDVTPGQEEGNAAYVVDNGVGELAENPVDALEILYHWLDREAQELNQRTLTAASLGRPRSAYTAAELVWQQAQQGRRVPVSRLREWAPRLVELLRSFDISVSDET